MAAASISANLSLAVAHAISFLTRPLIPSYPAAAIIQLRSVLEANLTAHYAPLWAVREPLYNSTRRCITLSPNCLPPSVIYSACLAAGVQWFDWISLLGGREFDLFVDPGRVSVRCNRHHTREKEFTSVWIDNPALICPTAEPLVHRTTQLPISRDKVKTLAQQLLEVDHEDDDQLFVMIADEVSTPTWITPIRTQPFAPIRPSSPLSTISAHSRSSSRSSNSSSGFSLVSAESSGSVTSMSTSPTLSDMQFRRERAKQTRVFVDTSKTNVTPYDGGKTTVLTGGVMLGGTSSVSRPGIGSKTIMRPPNNPHYARC